MIKPTIHLNGSSPEHLAASYMVAYYAVRDAIKALDDTTPNGRDYYPQSPGAITEATRALRAAGDRGHPAETVRPRKSMLASPGTQPAGRRATVRTISEM